MGHAKNTLLRLTLKETIGKPLSGEGRRVAGLNTLSLLLLLLLLLLLCSTGKIRGKAPKFRKAGMSILIYRGAQEEEEEETVRLNTYRLS